MVIYNVDIGLKGVEVSFVRSTVVFRDVDLRIYLLVSSLLEVRACLLLLIKVALVSDLVLREYLRVGVLLLVACQEGFSEGGLCPVRELCADEEFGALLEGDRGSLFLVIRLWEGGL